MSLERAVVADDVTASKEPVLPCLWTSSDWYATLASWETCQWLKIFVDDLLRHEVTKVAVCDRREDTVIRMQRAYDNSNAPLKRFEPEASI